MHEQITQGRTELKDFEKLTELSKELLDTQLKAKQLRQDIKTLKEKIKK